MEHQSVYRDDWDEIVSQFILQNEPFEGYWEESERYALNFVDKVLKGATKQRLLDLGCGRGRLLGRFADRFKAVVALDSDHTRLDKAKNAVRLDGLKNVEFVNGLFEDCVSDLGMFDMILCSHVIQHLPTADLAGMFKLIHKALVPGGILVLLTSHSEESRDIYKLWRIGNPGKRVVEERLHSAGAFNGCFVDGSNDQIPTHAFAIESLREYLDSFRLKRIQCFHALHKRNRMDALVFRDYWINFPWFKGLFGIDVLIIAEKLAG